ncbi:MAG: type II secretion system F family protein [Hyphomicrobium sp.]
MPRYSYRAYDRDGARIAGELAAATREGALETIVRRGQFPVELSDASVQRQVRWWEREVFASGRLPLPTLAMFTRELVSLVKADLPIDECLRLVAMQPMIPQRLRQVSRDLLARVTEGEALSDALAGEARAFPEFYWRLVRAGESSGSIGEALDDLARFLERSADMRGRIVSALLYPAVLIVAALSALAVIMTILIPVITPIFEEAGAEPPLMVRVLSGAASLINQNGLVILAAGAGLIVAGVVASKNIAVRRPTDRLLLAMPVIGRVIERRETGRLARTLSTLTRNGVPLLEAVRIGSGVLSNRIMGEAVLAAGEAIKEGGQLSVPLARSGVFSELFLRLATIGEQTGQLDVMLLRAAEIYEQALERQLQRLTSLVTPVVTLAIGAVVGGLVLSVMSALISVNDLAIR